MAMNDKISIVIPVFNGSQYLEQTLNSITAQTYESWEAILVDDSSTDNSYEILQSFAERDPRFKPYRKPNQRFACHGIKYGVERASGEWFCYMSQDDRLSPDYLEKTMAAATAADADIALGRLVRFHDEVETESPMPLAEGNVISGREAFELSLDWRIHGFYIIRMRLLKQVGVSTELLNDDEYDTRRHFFFAQRVAVSGGAFYYHDGNAQAITKKWDIAQLDFIKVAHKLRMFARDNGEENSGQIDRLLRTVSADACVRAAKMVFRAYRTGQATPHDIDRVIDVIIDNRPEWLGNSTALKLGTALRPIIGNRLALYGIIAALKLREQI